MLVFEVCVLFKLLLLSFCSLWQFYVNCFSSKCGISETLWPKNNPITFLCSVLTRRCSWEPWSSSGLFVQPKAGLCSVILTRPTLSGLVPEAHRVCYKWETPVCCILSLCSAGSSPCHEETCIFCFSMLVTFMQTLSRPNHNLKIKAKQPKITRKKSFCFTCYVLFKIDLFSKLNI